MISRVAAVVLGLFLTACDFTFPLTETPTQHVRSPLLGKWTCVNSQPNDHMTISALDDKTYVVSYNGDLYRAHHSDVAGLPLMSVQNLNDCNRKYSYVSWELSADGQQLTVKTINSDVIGVTTAPGAAIVKIIEANRDNPALFNGSGHFARDKESPLMVMPG